MLYGTEGDSRAIGFTSPRPLIHTGGPTLSPYAWFVPGSPVITGYLPRDERLLSSSNARERAQCPICNKTFSKAGSIKVCSKEVTFTCIIPFTSYYHVSQMFWCNNHHVAGIFWILFWCDKYIFARSAENEFPFYIFFDKSFDKFSFSSLTNLVHFELFRVKSNMSDFMTLNYMYLVRHLNRCIFLRVLQSVGRVEIQMTSKKMYSNTTH